MDVGRVLDHRAELRLALGEQAFGPHAVGHVAKVEHTTDDGVAEMVGMGKALEHSPVLHVMQVPRCRRRGPE